MATRSTDERLKELEREMERLQQFNQILLDHLLRVQDYGKAVAENIPVWLIDLSDALYQKYRYAPKL